MNRLVAILAFAALIGPANAQAWRPYATVCIAEIEKHHHTAGDWIYDAAACTARSYPATRAKTDDQIGHCQHKVYAETWNICQQCPPGRVDAVMVCLLEE
jgi:hypothetical protein